VQGLREFGEGKHRIVDDTPYGGGPGMVMRADVLERAFAAHVSSLDLLESSVRAYRKAGSGLEGISGEDVPFVVVLSPQGQKLNAERARGLASVSHLILLCGHYEGIDEAASVRQGFDR
jgi:tRNA (guanine37-N1)-methyltransferase